MKKVEGHASSVSLSERELRSYRQQGEGLRQGRFLRFYCPIHGSDHQRSLRLDPESGHFRCFQCDAWGYLDGYKARYLEEKKRRGGESHQKKKAWFAQREGVFSQPKHRSTEAKSSFTKEQRGVSGWQKSQKANVEREGEALVPVGAPDSLAPGLDSVLGGFRSALSESPGHHYLSERGIPLCVAEALGVGYALDGHWPHHRDGAPVRQWKEGRLVFPHTLPTGEICNLYGRAVEWRSRCPKSLRHAHLPGAKGIFHAKALDAEDVVFVCEGVFDALSLVTAGFANACAMFGLDGLPWDWVKARRVVLCLDSDVDPKRWQKLAWEGVLRGHEVSFLPQEFYQGYKDLNELWQKTMQLPLSWDEIEEIF